MPKEYALTPEGMRVNASAGYLEPGMAAIAKEQVSAVIKGDIMRELGGPGDTVDPRYSSIEFGLTDDEIREEFGSAGIRILNKLEEEGLVVSQEV